MAWWFDFRLSLLGTMRSKLKIVVFYISLKSLCF